MSSFFPFIIFPNGNSWFIQINATFLELQRKGLEGAACVGFFSFFLLFSQSVKYIQKYLGSSLCTWFAFFKEEEKLEKQISPIENDVPKPVLTMSSFS